MPHLARRSFALLFVVLLVVVGGCGGGEEAAPDAPPPRHTLVFIDRSASAGEAGSAVRAVFADSLRGLARRLLSRPGDRLSAFLVYQKTLSKAQRLDLRNDVPPRQTRDFADEQALEDARLKAETQRFVAEASDRLVAFAVRAPMQASFAQWTDLWGTLGVASEEFYVTPAERHMVYLSDMYESMPGEGRRDFDAEPPASRAEAEAWAAADAPTLRDLMVLDADRLRTATVRVIPGPLAAKPHAQDVKFYWLRLFEVAAGLPPAQVRYN
jgi:hypothetical protein